MSRYQTGQSPGSCFLSAFQTSAVQQATNRKSQAFSADGIEKEIGTGLGLLFR
ncbi:MAG: hypothetical protein IPN67_17670 [Bacteroidales bacterium]|nr:hypothetical protein [Bacteroidales bacterium]